VNSVIVIKTKEKKVDQELVKEIEELSNYDWGNELDTYKHEIVDELNGDQKKSLITDKKKRLFSVLFASLFGGTSMLLALAMIHFFIGGSPIIGGTFTALFFASTFGFNFLCKRGFDTFQKVIFKMNSANFIGYEDYEVTPRDLIGFWDEKVSSTLDEKSASLRRSTGEIKDRIQECRDALEECQKVDASVIDSDVVYDIEERIVELEEADQEIEKYRYAIGQLKLKFNDEVDGLQRVVEKEKELQKRHKEYENLNTKISSILGKSKSSVVKWEEEREKLKEEVSQMVGGFQNQLSYAGDLIKESLKLEYDMSEEKSE
jgi:hypothetical protein